MIGRVLRKGTVGKGRLVNDRKVEGRQTSGGGRKWRWENKGKRRKEEMGGQGGE